MPEGGSQLGERVLEKRLWMLEHERQLPGLPTSPGLLRVVGEKLIGCSARRPQTRRLLRRAPAPGRSLRQLLRAVKCRAPCGQRRAHGSLDQPAGKVSERRNRLGLKLEGALAELVSRLS